LNSTSITLHLLVPGPVSALVTRFLQLAAARLPCSWSWNEISLL